MILEHLYQGEPGAWKIVFRASAEELARALAAVEAEAGPAPDGGEEDRLAEAVNRAILAPDGFSTVWAEAVEKAGLQPVSDPDFKLTALNKAEGFRAEAVFFALPPLTLGQYTGFVQPIEPRPIRRLAIELEINQHHGAEERAADAAGKAQLRQQVIAGLYARRCEQARQLAQARLILCLGDQVTGPLPRQLMAEHYFAEQRRFHLSLQAQRVNFDQFLQVRGQTVEQFRAELHANAERRLRSRLGLLLVADRRASGPRRPRWTPRWRPGTTSGTGSAPSPPTTPARPARSWRASGPRRSSWSIPPCCRRPPSPPSSKPRKRPGCGPHPPKTSKTASFSPLCPVRDGG